jgi:hypothetical protein
LICFNVWSARKSLKEFEIRVYNILAKKLY